MKLDEKAIDPLTEANILKKEISDLEYFIMTLDVWLYRENSRVKSIIKKQTNTSYSILGTREFWSGTHAKTVNVPTCMIPSIVLQAKELLKQKQLEYDCLFAKTA